MYCATNVLFLAAFSESVPMTVPRVSNLGSDEIRADR